MRVYTLNIGEVVTHDGEAQYKCFGLGSCIGLFLTDKATGITGGAHILLPDNERGPDTLGWYSVELALGEMMRRFRDHGSSLAALSAKLAGGASTLGVDGMGKRNAESVLEQLRKRRIFVAASDVGGTQSRTVQYETATGNLTIHRTGEVTKRVL